MEPARMVYALAGRISAHLPFHIYPSSITEKVVLFVCLFACLVLTCNGSDDASPGENDHVEWNGNTCYNNRFMIIINYNTSRGS